MDAETAGPSSSGGQSLGDLLRKKYLDKAEEGEIQADEADGGRSRSRSGSRSRSRRRRRSSSSSSSSSSSRQTSNSRVVYYIIYFFDF